MGYVCGGPVAVITAVEEVIGRSGTLAMPTHSGDLSDPADWENPPVPKAWHETIKAEMPPYDVAMTPTRMMGAISETFRHQRDVLRSDHPSGSFAAWGAQARLVVEGQSLDDCFGESSPLARLYDLDGWVLLLGVGHDRNTSLHLAEIRASYPKKRESDGAPMIVDGERRWVTFSGIEEQHHDFSRVGSEFERECHRDVRVGRVALATARLMRQRALVDFAVGYFERLHR